MPVAAVDVGVVVGVVVGEDVTEVVWVEVAVVVGDVSAQSSNVGSWNDSRASLSTGTVSSGFCVSRYPAASHRTVAACCGAKSCRPSSSGFATASQSPGLTTKYVNAPSLAQPTVATSVWPQTSAIFERKRAVGAHSTELGSTR